MGKLFFAGMCFTDSAPVAWAAGALKSNQTPFPVFLPESGIKGCQYTCNEYGAGYK